MKIDILLVFLSTLVFVAIRLGLKRKLKWSTLWRANHIFLGIESKFKKNIKSKETLEHSLNHTNEINDEMKKKFKKSNEIISDFLIEISDEVKKINALSNYSEEIFTLAYDSKLPLLVVVMGEFKTGKSTFINALLGEDCLKSDVTPATAVVTMLKYGETSDLIAHFRDGREERYSMDKLDLLSAEGDLEGEELRSKISYLELYLSNPILKEITIVDTPGLNADKPLHSAATKEFIHRADLVLWIFSYAQAASKTEIAEIKNLGEHLKPLGIVNRIDEIDCEEDSVDKIIGELKKRMNTLVSHLIGVSAFQAREAQRTYNLKLLQESRWEEFKTLFAEELLNKCDLRKIKCILLKLKNIIKQIDIYISANRAIFLELTNKISSAELAIKRIEESRKNFNYLLQDWTPCNEYHYCFKRTLLLSDLPNQVENYQQLNLQKNEFEKVYHSLAEEARKAADERINLDFQMRDYRNFYAKYQKDLDIYNHSGIFGGEPLFDFSGRGDAIGRRAADLKATKEILDSQYEVILNKKKSLVAWADRIDLETKTFWKDVRDNVAVNINMLGDELNNVKQEHLLLKAEIGELTWIIEAENLMNNRVNEYLYKMWKVIENKLNLEQKINLINNIDKFVLDISMVLDGSFLESEEFFRERSSLQMIIEQQLREKIIYETRDLEFNKESASRSLVNVNG